MLKTLLNEKTKSAIARSVGLDYDQVLAMSAQQVEKHIEANKGCKLKPNANPSKPAFEGRGCDYLALGRFLPEMDQRKSEH